MAQKKVKPKLPEYKQSVAIKPAAAPGAEQAAMSGTIQAWSGMAAYSDKMAADASEMASRISRERAQQAGKDYAMTNPGEQISDGWFINDKVFKDSYNAHYANTLVTDANSAANRVTSEFDKYPDPTGELLTKSINTRQGIFDNAMEKMPAPHRADAKNLFKQKLEVDTTKLLAKVNAANLKKIKESYTVSENNKIVEMFDASKQDFDITKNLKNLNTTADQFLPYFGEEKTEENKRRYKFSHDLAIMEAELERRFTNGGEEGASEYVKQLNKIRTDKGGYNKISRLEMTRLVPLINKKFIEISNMMRAGDAIKYDNFKAKMDLSPVHPLDKVSYLDANDMTEAEQVLSAPARRKLTMENEARKRENEGHQLNIRTLMGNNSIAKDLMGDKQKDAAFNSIVRYASMKGGVLDSESLNEDLTRSTGQYGSGAPVSLESKLRIAEGLGTQVSVLNKELSAGINGTNPVIKKRSVELFSATYDRNPNVVSGITGDTLKTAIALGDQYDGGTDGELADKIVKEDLAKWQSKETRIKNERYEEERHNEYDGNINIEIKQSAKNLGIPPELLANSEAALFDYRSKTREYFVHENGNMKQALEYAKKMMEPWSETDVNGEPEYMKNAPTKNNPELLVKTSFLHNVEDLVSDNNKAFDVEGSQVPYKFILEKDEDVNYLNKFFDNYFSLAMIGIGLVNPKLYQDFKGPPTIRGKRIDRAGNVTKGIFRLKSDKGSVTGVRGDEQSYQVKFKPNGTQFEADVIDVNTMQPAREFVSAQELKRIYGLTDEDYNDLKDANNAIRKAKQSLRETNRPTFSPKHILPTRQVIKYYNFMKYNFEKINLPEKPTRVREIEKEMEKEIEELRELKEAD